MVYRNSLLKDMVCIIRTLILLKGMVCNPHLINNRVMECLLRDLIHLIHLRDMVCNIHLINSKDMECNLNRDMECLSRDMGCHSKVMERHNSNRVMERHNNRVMECHSNKVMDKVPITMVIDKLISMYNRF